MQDRAYIVTVVLDPDFGSKLRTLPTDAPIWAVDSPTNRVVGEMIWQERQHVSATDGLTLFKVDPGENPSEWLAQVIPDIDLHHGEYSHAPPLYVLAVIGISVTDAVRTALADYGLGMIKEHANGFRASRS